MGRRELAPAAQAFGTFHTISASRGVVERARGPSSPERKSARGIDLILDAHAEPVADARGYSGGPVRLVNAEDRG